MASLYDRSTMLDSETKAVEHDHADELRLWLRLLTCTTLIEGAVRGRLRERFDVTLPRFDLMAQLDRAPDGMTLSDVSKRMMVSNGNVTGLVERLVGIRPSRPAYVGFRSPRAGDPSDQARPRRVSPDGRRARDLDRRHLFRADAEGCPRIDAAARQGQGLGAEIRQPPRAIIRVAGIDYEVEYNNRARVPENPALMAGWARDAAAYRAEHTPRQIAYGAGPRNTIDLFSGDGQGPIVVFIHGGYWQALDGSSFSHCARGLNAHGIDVAVPSYDLCPQVAVDTIIDQMRAAARELARLGRPLVISGHSAGGHLAACLLATDWPAQDAFLPKDLVIAAYAISGLFDLVPLVETSINKALGLDEAAARAASPLFWRPPAHGSLDAVVGETESAEYHRQSRIVTETWARQRTSDPLWHCRRRQSFHRDCAARRSCLADGAAAEGTGAAVGPDKPRVGWPGFPLLRPIILSLKCLRLKRYRAPFIPERRR